MLWLGMSMAGFGATSYAIVGTLYAALSVLLLSSWRGSHIGGYLIAACTASAVWGGALSISMLNDSVPAIAVFGIEILRGGAWLTFLVVLALKIGVSRIVGYLAHAIWVGVLIAGIALSFARDDIDPTANLESVLIPGHLLIALAGLMVIEQLYRNAPTESRWGIKALAMGLGGLFTYDLFLYSQGLFLESIDATVWTARGAVNVLFVPLIAIAARRNPAWDLDVFISRQVVFYSTSLVAVGVYLLLMAFGGYALLLYGGTWGGLAQIIFLVGASLVLIAMLFSRALRARFKVFLSKHFFSQQVRLQRRMVTVDFGAFRLPRQFNSTDRHQSAGADCQQPIRFLVVAG